MRGFKTNESAAATRGANDQRCSLHLSTVGFKLTELKTPILGGLLAHRRTQEKGPYLARHRFPVELVASCLAPPRARVPGACISCGAVPLHPPESWWTRVR